MFSLRALFALVMFFACLGGLWTLSSVSPQSPNVAIIALVGAFGLSLAALLSVMTWIHDIEQLRKNENRLLAVFADATAMVMIVILLSIAIRTVYLLLGRL